jgi:FAD/FMN-containing dehydrogenase
MNKMDKIYDPVHLEGDVWTVEIETGVQVKSLDDLLRKHDPPLALPSNVVLDKMRFGGILSLGCHGAATHSRTLSDLVHSVKIVDASGNVNVFSKDVDPVEFSAATVNLGLLGIIYSYTLRIEPMFKLHLVSVLLSPSRFSHTQCVVRISRVWLVG